MTLQTITKNGQEPKDRGKDPASAPWFPVFQGAQINDYHSVCISHEKPLQLFIWRG